jgi:hypothetical protein
MRQIPISLQDALDRKDLELVAQGSQDFDIPSCDRTNFQIFDVLWTEFCACLISYLNSSLLSVAVMFGFSAELLVAEQN